MEQHMIPLLSTTPVAVDVETGGLDPTNNALLSIGAYSAGREFYIEICPPASLRVDEEALKVNGLTIEGLRTTGVEEIEAIQQLFDFLSTCGDVTVLGQNPSFDLGFIAAACARVGVRSPLGRRAIDLHSVALTAMVVFEGGYPVEPVKYHPDMARTCSNLDNILHYVGIAKRPGFHNALEDARLAYLAWERLVEKFSNTPIVRAPFYSAVKV